MTKNVAGTPFLWSMSSTAGVAGPGPSSKVSATVRTAASATGGAVWTTPGALDGQMGGAVGACWATLIVGAAASCGFAFIARTLSLTAPIKA
jgi:hypothetical protein